MFIPNFTFTFHSIFNLLKRLCLHFRANTNFQTCNKAFLCANVRAISSLSFWNINAFNLAISRSLAYTSTQVTHLGIEKISYKYISIGTSTWTLETIKSKLVNRKINNRNWLWKCITDCPPEEVQDERDRSFWWLVFVISFLIIL